MESKLGYHIGAWKFHCEKCKAPRRMVGEYHISKQLLRKIMMIGNKANVQTGKISCSVCGHIYGKRRVMPLGFLKDREIKERT
jgi:uncharacterized Zn finger protein (UPF0148 family)